MNLFDENKLSAFVRQKDWESCWMYFEAVLRLIESKELQKIYAGHDSDTGDIPPELKKQIEDLFGAVAKNILNFLAHPEIPISDERFKALIFCYETIHNTLAVAGLGDTDAAVQKLVDHQKKMSKDHQKKMLLLISMRSNMAVAQFVQMTFVQYRNLALIAFFGYSPIYHPAVYNNKMQLLKMGKSISNVQPDIPVLESLVRPYFRVSYLDDPRKHDLKKHVNVCVQNFKSKHRQFFPKIDKTRAPQNPDKPVLLVFAETMKENHAMFRSWVARFESFRKKFHLVFVAHDKDGLENVMGPLCDEFFEINSERLDIALQKIADVKPDILFLPSVGMTITSVFLANHRWAPIQVMALGHPATTHSRDLDYVIGPKDLYSPDCVMSEKWIAIDTPFSHTQHQGFDRAFLGGMEKTAPKERVNVFTSGMLYKLSAPYFAFLKEMIDEADFDIDLSIITGAKGPSVVLIQECMEDTFGPDVKVYGYHGYRSYLERVSQADITLNPFPFGHSHTMLDALICGKPCVSLLGTEPHSRTEYAILKRLGLDEKFVVQDKDAYKQKFYALCRDIMNGDTDFFDPQQIYKEVYESKGDYDFGALFRWIFDHHQEMQSSKDKIFFADI